MSHDLSFLTTRSPLKRRLLLLAGLGIWSALLIVGISDYLAIRQGIGQIMRERLILTRVVGNQVDHLLKENLALLENVSLAPGFNLEDDNLQPEKNALHNASLQSVCTHLFLLDSSGNIVWEQPRRNLPLKELPPIRNVIESEKPVVSNVVENTIFLLVPILKEGQVAGVVGGTIEKAEPQLQTFLQEASLGGSLTPEIVDGRGIIVAGQRTGNAFQHSNEAKWLLPLLAVGKPTIQIVADQEEVVSVVPLSGISWAVVIRQPEKEMMAPVTQMKSRFFALGSLLLLLILVLTMGMAYSVIAPVRRLTESAKKIAAGNLKEPISVSGSDEIGKLGETLNEMRRRLNEAILQIGRMNEELETRVDSRTREVLFLCEELKKKEEAKGELLRKVISAQEEERKRIARELHDDLSQDLAVLLLFLNSGNIGADKIDSMRKLISRAGDKVHEIMFDLRPSILDDLGLISALKWYAEERLNPKGISVHFESEYREQRLNPQVEIVLFRIAQEALSNIVRHSGAENVLITLERRNHSLMMEIEDDGSGFDLFTVSKPEENGIGLGILGMKERASLCNGMLHVDSQPGGGTRIAVEIPIEEIHEQVEQNTSANCG